MISARPSTSDAHITFARPHAAPSSSPIPCATGIWTVSRGAVGVAPEGAIYTCPMHPQIRQVGPGDCPICGMALEPLLATAEAGPNLELADFTRRFWIGTVL